MSTEVLPTQQNWFHRQSGKWRRDVAFVLYQARMLRLLLMHPLVPRHAKLSRDAPQLTSSAQSSLFPRSFQSLANWMTYWSCFSV